MIFSEQRALQIGAEEIARRGETIYETQLRSHLDTSENSGRFLSIDIDTGNYLLGERMDTLQPLREQNPDAIIYTLKIGYPAAFTTAGRMTPLPR